MLFYKPTPSRRCFLATNTFLCVLVALLCLFPLVYILAISFSSKAAIMAGKVTVFPVEFTLENYRYVADDARFYRAFWVSVKRTALGLAVQLSFTVLAAYPLSLSRRRFKSRGFYSWLFMIAILFYGGLVPNYLVVLRTGLIDTIWSLILPGAVPIFYVILMQNFMKSVPEEIIESAEIDGAGQFRILVRIMLPLCEVSIATVALFIIVDNWNAWYDGMLYINDSEKFPLQTYLRTVIVQVDTNLLSSPENLSRLVATTGADSAKIFLSMIPIMVVYPFVQKHFVKGIVVGSVKE